MIDRRSRFLAWDSYVAFAWVVEACEAAILHQDEEAGCRASPMSRDLRLECGRQQALCRNGARLAAELAVAITLDRIPKSRT